MCIVLGGPFLAKVGFQKIKAIRVTNRLTMSVNFITKLTKYSVEIAKKKRPSIANSFDKLSQLFSDYHCLRSAIR